MPSGVTSAACALIGAALILAAAGNAAAGPNHDLTLPLHAELGPAGCSIPDPCDPGPPRVNIPPGSLFTAYLLFRNGDNVAGIQTAFDWGDWSFQGANWMCQINQIVGTSPSGNGGPEGGTIATAFDCVFGPVTEVVGTMVFYAGQSGCLQQVMSAFPFGNCAVSCTGDIDQIPPGDWGAICVETGGVNACAEGPETPPVCDAGGPYAGPIGFPLQLDGTGSSDPDGYLTSYAWEFGDGATGTGAMPEHTYLAVGVFTVTLCVIDNDQNEVCCPTIASMTDENFPPICVAGGPYQGDPGEPVTFDGRESSDPDGTITTYAWEFGDGATGAGPTTTHTYGANGVYTVTLCVTDNAGDVSCCATSAHISDELIPPVCDHGGPYSGMQGQVVLFDGRASSDPDGTITSYEWDFGDGATGNGSITSHVYSDTSGTFEVTLCVIDDDNLESCCGTIAHIAPPPPPNDADIGLVLHAVVTAFGPCDPPTPPCPEPTTMVHVGESIAVYLVVDNFQSLAGVQTAFDWSFQFTFGLWDCQPNQVAGTTPTGPGPTSGTIATAFNCITGAGRVVIGRMHFVATAPGCVTQPQSSFPFGNHVIDCSGEVTQITAPTCLGSVCAAVEGVNACAPCLATPVEATSWGKIKQHFRR